MKGLYYDARSEKHQTKILFQTIKCRDHFSSSNKLKSKGLPRQAEVAQGVPGRLSPRIILTFRHYKGGRSSAIRTGHLYPRRNPWYSLSEAGSTSGHMVLSRAPRKKSSVTPPGIDPGTVRLVDQPLNHHATPSSSSRGNNNNNNNNNNKTK